MMNDPAVQPADGAPRWAQSILRVAGGNEGATEAIGDLHEVHRERVARWGGSIAAFVTTFDALDVAWALRRQRRQMRDCGLDIRMSLLDFKLGYRMLRRYPALTVVAVLAMSFGVAGGAALVEFTKSQMFPPLPYIEPDRIVGIDYLDRKSMGARPTTVADFDTWRTRLRGVDQLHALRIRTRSFVLGDRPARAVSEAAITPSAFSLLKTRPVLGRGLIAADAEPGAAPVAVISHALWRSEFGEREDAIGSTVRIGGNAATVVGVMGRTFSFFTPSSSSGLAAQQDLYVPLHRTASGSSGFVSVFGRLAPGMTLDRFRTEHGALLGRLATEDARYRDLSPRVLPFPRPFSNAEGVEPAAMLSLGTLFVAGLMLLICGNVALLVFARAATREREIAVRNALGASRGRIIGQLFAESVALATLSAIIGLVGAAFTLRWADGVLREMLAAQGVAMPGWLQLEVTPTTVIAAFMLANLGAIVTGVLPGLRVTSGGGVSALARISGSGSGIRMSGVWSRIIVAQVALTAMLIPIAFIYARQTMAAGVSELQLPAGSFLHARLQAIAEPSVTTAAIRWSDVKQRLLAQPEVSAVAAGSRMPGSWHEGRMIEAEGAGMPGLPKAAQVARVDGDFFTVLGARFLDGSGFADSDTLSPVQPVVVNRSFVEQAMGGRVAVGQRIRFGNDEGPKEPWMIIVGVIADLPMTIEPTVGRAGVYVPLRGDATARELVIATKTPTAGLAARLPDVVSGVSPMLQVERAIPLSMAGQATIITYRSTLQVIVVAGLLAILLTNAGIYAVISFTVARRTREIGVRVAMGAVPWQIVRTVMSRMVLRVASGVVVGATVGSVAAFGFAEGSFEPGMLVGAALVGGCMAGMLIVCIAACVVPIRRALGIQPTQALRAES